MLLAIDTSTRYAGVALVEAGQVLSARCWFSRINHTADLMPAISETLGTRGVACRDLAGIAVALGPGGFSALRVGLSAAKGLALAGGIPLIGIGTLDLEAFPYSQCGLPVCAMLDAGRSEVAVARFDAAGQRASEDIICPPEELLPSFTEPTLFCGEGTVLWKGLISDTLGNRAVLAHSIPSSRVWSLAELGQQRLLSGQVSDLVTLQPEYIRMPSIGQAKRRDWVPQGS